MLLYASGATGKNQGHNQDRYEASVVHPGGEIGVFLDPNEFSTPNRMSCPPAVPVRLNVPKRQLVAHVEIHR